MNRQSGYNYNESYDCKINTNQPHPGFLHPVNIQTSVRTIDLYLHSDHCSHSNNDIFVFDLENPIKNIVSMELLNINLNSVTNSEIYEVYINDIERIRMPTNLSSGNPHIKSLFSVVRPIVTYNTNNSYIDYALNNKQIKEYATPLASIGSMKLRVFPEVENFQIQIQIKYIG